MSNTRIFIVEDDKFYCSLLDHHLSLNPDYEVHKFSTGKECLTNLYLNPDVITLDYSLPDTTGYDILRKIKSNNKDVPVIIVSGQEDVGTAVELLKEGAYDYIIKDENTHNKLWSSLIKIKENLVLKKELIELREEVSQKYTFEKAIKGNSQCIKKIFALMEKAAQSNITVSVTGETGTGKEVVAKAIHYNSSRSTKPFVAVNMGAIPRDLAESELFGYEKGAFTGANTRRVGKFEEASQGTIFLDEIAEMDMNLQSKILRVIQEREVTRVGGSGSVKLDVRIIVATHRNLLEEVKKGNFREDLYYRLLGLPIELPPLREREKDVLVIAKYFVEEFCKQNKMAKKHLDVSAQEKLLSYSFPGNIRELKAMVELAVVLSDGDEISAADIRTNPVMNTDNLFKQECSLKEYNINIIKYYMEKYDNDVLLVAQKLDIGKSTIYRMIKNKEI